MWETEYEHAKELYYNKEYKQCLNISLRLLKKIKKYTSDKTIIFYIYFITSVSLNMLNYTEESIKYITTAKEYAILYFDKMRVDWQLGWCYEKINKIQSIKYYKKALFYCCNYIDTEEYIYLILSDLARLADDETSIINAINDYKRVSINLAYIDELYEYLFYYYIEKNEKIKAKNVLQNISDIKSRNNLFVIICDKQKNVAY